MESSRPFKGQTLSVDLGERSYPIEIGAGMFQKDLASLLSPHLTNKQVMIVTNETVAPLYLDAIISQLQKVSDALQIDTVVLPDGEQYKKLSSIETVYDELLSKRHSRGTTMIALGGGVVGDMTGFAAATYQRGVNFIQIPTTLLAQVDSSVGGKTGVNHPSGKNMIGAFYQPRAVLIDLESLKTLSKRDYNAGLAEVVKYGLIWDQAFFEWLEQNCKALVQRDLLVLQEAVKRSCEIKAEVVRQDEREGGLRAILNLGHTFGHAIETATKYEEFLHGEAVAIGMVMAVDLSERLGWLEGGWKERLLDLLTQMSLPTVCPDTLSGSELRALMQHDKKVLDKSLRLVLLKKCGKATVTSDYDEALLAQVLGV